RAPIIYNGKILTTAEATEEKLKPESGYVTVKNVNSEEFQVILVWDFQNYVVQTVSDKQIVYDLFGEKLDFSEESLVIDVVLDGETISLTELKSGDILSVAASLDGGYYKIFASRKTLNGTINSTKNTPQTVYNVTADGEKHALYLAKNYQRYLAQNSSKVSELYPGDSAVFYLDYFGDIAYSGDAVQQTNMQYGYIVDVADESSLFGSRSLHLKIMNETNQFVVYDVTKDDAFKYGVVENGVYVTKNNPFDTFCDQVIGTEGVIRQPVKYKTDVTGKLRECYLLDSVGSGDIWGDSVSTTYSYAYYNGTIDGQYLVDGNTIGFYIPSAGDEIELFKSGRAVTMMSSAAYDVQLYDIVDNRVGLVLIKTHIPSDNGYQYMLDMVNNPVMLIESVGKQLVDGESLTYVTGWQNGEVVTVTVADTLEENSDDRNLLQAGMLIQYLTNTEERSRAETSAEPEKMILFRTIEDFNRSSIPNYQKWNYMNNENSNAKIRVISGTVAAYDLPNMLVNCGANAAVSVDDGVNVICWNNKTKTAEKATIHDIMLNERVFVRTRYNVTKDIYIFE
ncbi:MAG: hypothetical protein U0L92_04575, partial [Clostridia bacterium]|nr:hypothetical protein [Clostridia bacterium]